MPYKKIEDRRKEQNKWAKDNRAKKREWNKNLRIKVINLLGGKCVNCGCDDINALEINHQNGGGGKEKREIWNGSYRTFLYAILNGTRSKDDLEVTCKVCNSFHYLKEIKGLKGNWKIEYIKVVGI